MESPGIGELWVHFLVNSPSTYSAQCWWSHFCHLPSTCLMPCASPWLSLSTSPTQPTHSSWPFKSGSHPRELTPLTSTPAAIMATPFFLPGGQRHLAGAIKEKLPSEFASWLSG